MSRRLVLVRHCTTSWNREGRIQGKTNIPLDDGGREEARVLSQELAKLGIGLIISSDLDRAAETARIFAETLGLPVKTDARLREVDFGALEGMTKAEVLARYGESAAEHWQKSPGDYDLRPFGGEHRAAVVERHLAVVFEIEELDVDTALIVAHGRGLNTLLETLSEEPTLERNEWRVVDL